MRIFLLLIIISTSLLSCQKSPYNSKNQGDTENIKRSEPLNNGEDLDESYFTSDLRTNEYLLQCVIYTDTVQFITFDTPGDYTRITVSKNGKECYLLNSIDNNTLSKGDSIIIKWHIVENHAIEDSTSVWLEPHLIELKKLK